MSVKTHHVKRGLSVCPSTRLALACNPLSRIVVFIIFGPPQAPRVW